MQEEVSDPMSRMRFAPLRYALALVRFPRLLDMAGHVAAFQEQVRATYPLVDEHNNVGMVAHLSNQGFEFRHVTEKMWQFSEPGRSHAIILGPDFLLVHAGTAYEGHDGFFARLCAAVQALGDTPGMGVTHATAVGYRMIDLVEPRVGTREEISDYLKPWALPTDPADFGDQPMELQEGAYIASFKTGPGTLRFQALRRPKVPFPPDLLTPLVEANGWIPKVAAGDFVLLDIDHFAAFDPAMPLDPRGLLAKFRELHGPSRRAFDSAVRPRAVTIWDRRKA
ncbi:TIGR04255 family protein [Roseomonas frigidaquae]|uniref:TIGR04255 family protein n=1 Tax=Falsiroseomonas frigidaquae TaxID=487318 RepID=A0ABX1EYL9_9PROT|nr:TIGR04255 family protein [Falsiroseomonas frigidaquae]NKE45155.1 TIGR04255 family protein [Falsiroseomonas frigidaquae]